MSTKRIVIMLIPALLLASFGWFVYAKAKADSIASTNSTTVHLYAQANKQNLVANLSPSEKLIPIIKKDGWLKVGIAKSGDVGWINLAQWRQARADFLKPDIQAFYLYTDVDNHGKPITNVIAYKNGKKLSDSEAKSLYESVKQKQQEQQQEMAKLHDHFRQLFKRFIDTEIEPEFYI